MYLLPLHLSFHTKLCLITLRYPIWKCEKARYIRKSCSCHAAVKQDHQVANITTKTILCPPYTAGHAVTACSAIQTMVITPRILNDLHNSSLKHVLYFSAHVSHYWKSTTKCRREWIDLQGWKIRPVNVWPISPIRARGLQIIHWKWSVEQHIVYVESFVGNLRRISLPKGIQFIGIKRRNWLTHPVSCLWVAPSILLVSLTLLSENDTRSHKQELYSITTKHHAARLCCSQKHKILWSPCFPSVWLIVSSYSETSRIFLPREISCV